MSTQIPQEKGFGVAENQLHNQFNQALFLADDVVTKNYLSRLHEMDILPLDDEMHISKSKEAVRLIRVDEIIYSPDEYAIPKFASVLGALTAADNNVFLLIDSDGDTAKFYMGVRCDNPKGIANSQLITLKNSLHGQFPGIKTTEETEYKNPDIIDLMQNIKSKKGNYVSSVSCVANLRDEQTRENKMFLQGIEKFVIAMQGQKYSALILARNVSADTLENTRRAYETIYSNLSPFANTQLSHGTNSGWSITDAFSYGTSTSVTISTNISHTSGTSDTEGTSVSQDNTLSRVMGAVGMIGGAVQAGLGVAAMAAASGASGGAGGAAIAPFVAPMIASGAVTAAGGMAAALTKKTTTTNASKTTNESHTVGKSEAHADTESENYTVTKGASGGDTDTLNLTIQNKSIINTLERIDVQLKRINECESFGVWDCATYFLSDSMETTEMAAGAYKALVQGKYSGVETAAINLWSNTKNPEKIGLLNDYLTNFLHPQFLYPTQEGCFPTTASSQVSTNELAIHIGLPRQSVCGLRVIEHANFGKEIRIKKKGVSFGKIYNMGAETKADAQLDIEALTMHTFVTGSTGSGKSNTLYTLINELCFGYSEERENPTFLVIEPAKGEYKNVFGGCATVYGTNPYKVPNLLQINPFSFPKGIHVLEHIDRLVEVFNACWPMYAAMPAILREAVEESYEKAGWNLRTSKYIDKFPTFDTLLAILPKVIDKSEYSQNTASDYKGALQTRVRSLTKGIQGMIFREDTKCEDLFNRNAIVDLSRVGSSETKALIMGILVLKLQEFRMHEGKINAPLRHITILEEAHNLLRRTSGEQSQESSNLQGKSVEMLANSIAEMRTYGEGFVIADQSPGLMDMSVIRNTNTKIILRLPDESDRALVGKSAGLNDEQIVELSKLEIGVAAVSQNGWSEPVLCKIDEFKNTKPMEKDSFGWNDTETEAVKDFIKLVFDVEKIDTCEIDTIHKWKENTNLSDKAKKLIDKRLRGYKLNNEQKELLLYGLAGKQRLNDVTDTETGVGMIEEMLKVQFGFAPCDSVVKVLCSFFAEHFPERIAKQGNTDGIKEATM